MSQTKATTGGRRAEMWKVMNQLRARFAMPERRSDHGDKLGHLINYTFAQAEDFQAEIDRRTLQVLHPVSGAPVEKVDDVLLPGVVYQAKVILTEKGVTALWEDWAPNRVFLQMTVKTRRHSLIRPLLEVASVDAECVAGMLEAGWLKVWSDQLGPVTPTQVVALNKSFEPLHVELTKDGRDFVPSLVTL